MRKHSFWIACMLLLASLSGCGPAQPSAPDTSTEPTATSGTAPADPALPPKPTAGLATQPPATSMPTVEPTAAPTATMTSTALLPADTIWVQSANVVLPLADSSMPLDLTQRGYPTPIYWPKASPNGAYIVYGTDRGGLVLVNVRTGVSRTLVEDGNSAAGSSFSPDSREFAITTIAGDAWTLQVFGLENNGVRVLKNGSTVATDPNNLPFVPSPVAWLPDGLLVQRLLWASDAPPRDLIMLDPSSGAERRVYEGETIGIYPSPDGTRFALTTGQRPIGGVPTTQIRVINQQGSQVAAIRDEQPGLVQSLQWSPDGSMILYALSPAYQTPNITLNLVHADGSNAQELDLAAAGLSGAFRDIAWRDNATLLLLTENGQLQLDALPTNNFSAVARQPLRTFQDQHPGNGNTRILYVPG